MNLDSAGGDAADYPGEELIPAFNRLQLPGYLNQVRGVLFGTTPDRHMMNYRVRELLAVTHSTPLEEYLLALDPRVSYSLDGDDWPAGVFLPAHSRTSGTESDLLTVVGGPEPPDVSGRCRHAFTVDVLTPGSVEVTQLTPPNQKMDIGLSVPAGLSNAVPLRGSGYSVRLATDNVGQSWVVEVINRPTRTVAQLVASVASLGEPTIDSLFGITQEEPFFTFRNLWQRKLELPLKAAAMVCALALRTEERRLNNG